ncbi:MAG: M48 family metalloprotease, partial [Gammaproteobacteria bacterium]|nr:M48 family metalloprotease [Gammaproteobacteria bacterium]
LQAYVQEVGDRLARKSHRNNLIFRFTVLDSREVNAFALPGGYIYITRGLMAYLKNEAELAAVLGHEIGHVTARHSVRQYSATQLANIGATLGSIFIPGMNTAAGGQLVQVFGTALLRGYGRDHELEADRLGAEYLATTGYDPQAMLHVIGVLKDQEVFETQRAKEEGREPRIYHGVFATHPANDQRLQEVVGHADLLKTHAEPYWGVETFMDHIDGVVFGDSPKEGITRGNNFYHEGLAFSFSFPKGWHMTNRPDRLIISAPNGDALLQLTAEDLNKRMTPRQFMIERLGLSNLSNDNALNIHGNEAHTGTSAIDTSFGQRLARLAVIYYNKQAYILAGITRDPKAIARYDGAFLATIKSFHALTPNEQILAKPLRLKSVKAGLTSFAELARSSPLEKYAEEQLRLLNGLYPRGEPAPDSLIKIVE